MFKLHRLVAAAAAVGALVGAVPSPAVAAPVEAPFRLVVPDVGVSNVTGSYVPPVLVPGESAPQSLAGVRITVDAGEVAGFASVSFMARECSVSCDLGAMGAPGTWRLPQMLVKPKAGAAVGTSGSVEVTVRADGYEPVVATAKLTVTDVDVVAGPPVATYTVRNGTEKAQVVLQVTNRGRETVSDLTFAFAGDPGLRWRPSAPDVNCRYGGGGVSREVFYGPEMFCDVHNFDLEPGQTYELTDSGLMAPEGELGDRYAFRATFWAGPGAENVTDALRQLPGMYAYSHGINAPRRIPAGSGAPVSSGLMVVGALTVGAPATTTPPGTPGEPVPSATATPGEPTPSAEPTTPGESPTPGETATVIPAPGQGGGGGDGDGGGLPVTGSNVTIAAGLGVLLLAAGAAAFVTARRRRTRFTA
ncbi:LPXTG cell wall anchor domain-containing protein [Actinoplanes sp. Pm04-4]|uniref:LPXTG cell wall anchor domain-containing protein n=1 Tax=Paractinoplanes pyxinae TaxID=2997416 RepID=A0ABT4AY41_9ACTN|nr:LPXTG cell wall anchor domain-containing protein [Actinoplanes pyxinae]MCY1139159.1 LPXTG cell wall anchor domain-containing protein [Actinoplanes pyxinae]